MGIKTKVEISTADLGIAWQKNATYRIALEEDFVHEDGGDQQPNPENTNLLTFTTNATGPVISSTIPSVGSQVNGYSEIQITFDRKIILGTGFIKIYKDASPDELISTYNVSETYTGQVTVGTDNKTLHIDIDGFFVDANSTYYFTMDSTVIKDYDDFNIDAISDTTTLRFLTGTAPSLVTTIPADNATGFTGHTITLTFDRNIKKQSGYISLKKSSDDTIVYNWSMSSNDNRVKISGYTVTLDCTFLLDPNTSYYITIGAAAIRDASGIFYSGFSNNSTLNFTTGTSVDAGSIRWLDGPFWGGVLHINYPNGTALIATTDNSTNHTKGIKLYSQGGTLIHTFYAGDGNTSTNGYASKTITLDVGNYVQEDLYYYILIDDGAYYDNNTNLTLSGISDVTRLTFNTIEGLERFGDFTYIANDSNPSVFNTFSGWSADPFLKIIQANSADNYSLILTSTIGKFGYNSNTPQSTLTITGTDSQLHNYLITITFYPNYNTTSNGTYTITLKRGSTVIDEETHNITYASTNTNSEIITFTSNGTWTPSYEQYTYRPNATVLLVGAGGAGGTYTGGGGGGVIEQSGITITNTSYVRTLNGTRGGRNSVKTTTTRAQVSGGTIYEYQYENGTDTVMFGLTAGGGKGAYQEWSTVNGDYYAKGGDSGIPQSNAGGIWDTSTGAGGGGAGEVANGIRKSALGIDSTILGSLGGSKLGAGGEDNGPYTRSYNRDLGHGGGAGMDGSKGIIVVKLSP